MLTTENVRNCAQARPVSIIEQLEQLPPPWEASPEEVAELAKRVGFPIVYEVGENPGWHAVMDFQDEGDRNRSGKPMRRYEQIRRMFNLIAFLAPRTVGASLEEVQEETHSQVCDRTIRRDLNMLIELGLIVKERVDDVVRYYWNDRSVRGAVLHHVARAQEMVW